MRAYVDAIAPSHRALFERVDRLVRTAHPAVRTVLSYKMPTYAVGDRRLHVAVWKHGLSLYGWDASRDGGFTARHPELDNGRGTLRLPLEVASGISDDELLDVVRGALDA